MEFNVRLNKDVILLIILLTMGIFVLQPLQMDNSSNDSTNSTNNNVLTPINTNINTGHYHQLNTCPNSPCGGGW